jgi:endonuclease/exonuclease/phosphatase family metal-dependent hydrolase
MSACSAWRPSRPVIPVISVAIWVSFVTLSSGQQPPARFAVANWNVRSGMGIAGKKNPRIDSDSTNCSVNASKPGGPFWPAMNAVKDDPHIVALGVQEAWACATPQKIRDYLGWKHATEEQNGTALVTRYGLQGRHIRQQIAFAKVEGANEDQWLFGGDVCLDEPCSSTIRVYVAHFSAPEDPGFVAQARNTLMYVESQPSADRNIIIGDLNFYMANHTFVPCASTQTTSPPADVFESAGYVDAWKLLKPNTDGPTGMWNREHCGKPEGGLFKRIDYIYSRGIKPIDVRLFAMIKPMEEDAPSDHAGIVATFAAR